ncbi:MAG: geranylgeranyl reductase family protein [Armatimonadetes bacterium]|nr:geranylgeranyl reductase family protein [Armatimonadota bacterium]MDE2207709.1 geranylgeranyl reductase family protein [Armatimonadota bacterium]
MAHFDAIVIGSGPAGSTAAFHLALGGASVALLERYRLPRHKTCGGGMPMTMADQLEIERLGRLAPGSFVEAEVEWMRHTWMFGDASLAPLNPNGEKGHRLALWMVQRAIFDAALARRAADAGAVLIDEMVVKSVEVGGPPTVRACGPGGDWNATCAVVIGADGANGVTAKCTGLRSKRALAIGMELEVPHRWGDGHATLRRDVAHLEYGAVPRGYAWVFPKAEHLNVGAGVFRPRRADGRGDAGVRQELQAAIVAYLAALDLPKPAGGERWYAHPLPIYNGMDTVQTSDGRVLLAGDAAGLINPFFGDGILHAVKSGKLAAEAVLKGAPQMYAATVDQEFKRNFDAALRLARFFYQFPGMCYRNGVQRPMATRTAGMLLSGEVGFHQMAGRAMRRMRSADGASDRVPQALS